MRSETYLEMKKDVFVCFVDYDKAFTVYCAKIACIRKKLVIWKIYQIDCKSIQGTDDYCIFGRE